MSSALPDLLLASFAETLLMTGASGLLGSVAGGVLGLYLHLTRHYIIPSGTAARIVGLAVRGLHSTPSIIILAASIPLTHFLMGSNAGMIALIIPLSVIATSFAARYVEAAMDGVDRHIIEAAQTMGASCRQIICKILLPEAAANIIAGLGITLASLVGYSALAGAMGGGGLGDLGIRYGYANFLPEVMLASAIMLVVLAETFHVLGLVLAQRLNQR
ncbi:ABC transporter permease subunit [Pusillimonas sp. MFBS29]|uniref:methionine ABC transporter permease n=1 Tax=Pusillimonas sp. MFBS29 TaxID=2886690 RepID=UPI001D0FE32A|nr:ABC transporter permease subunit [Pusillimonas sp. MFBS29]MCC2594971.1 ABC transporter permease subunit [Pusillimonas sp. MFBS29]